MTASSASPSPWTIRAASERDLHALARTHRLTASHAFAPIFPPEAPLPSMEEFLDAWRENFTPAAVAAGTRAFVAETDDTIGVVVAAPAHLSRLYVLPAWWGRGVGRALYETAMRHIAELGSPRVTLWVLEGNVSARAWYERLGWVLTGARKPVYAPGGIDDVEYAIDLMAS